ncbi:MAG: nuclear transport factor 2 family protein [Nitrospiraceae bacterium]
MRLIRLGNWLLVLLLTLGPGCVTTGSPGPEEVLRALVHANAEKDLATLSTLMAHDADIISYSIGGRKYVGWNELAREMQNEFASVARLEIPITHLTVWTHGDTAWFAMELDYIRYVETGNGQTRTALPLRETGVLERRNGQWLLLAWHESSRSTSDGMAAADPVRTIPVQTGAASPPASEAPDLSGEWDIQEEDKSYRATLDRAGNGPYTHQNGRIATTSFAGRTWQGTWHQPGNDREGGFEVLLSDDGSQAQGVWWYTRVGDKNNIPPRQWGGSYVWKRLNSHSSHAP